MSLLDDRTIYRDKNIGSGDAPIALANLLLPANIAAPASWAITAGDSGGQWAISSGVINPAGAGVTAGTYTLTITATWSVYAAPFNTDTATLTVIVPANTVYVDPVSGAD